MSDTGRMYSEYRTSLSDYAKLEMRLGASTLRTSWCPSGRHQTEVHYYQAVSKANLPRATVRGYPWWQGVSNE